MQMGKMKGLLFTQHEIEVAEERAKKNAEDLTTKTYFTDFLD